MYTTARICVRAMFALALALVVSGGAVVAAEGQNGQSGQDDAPTDQSDSAVEDEESGGGGDQPDDEGGTDGTDSEDIVTVLQSREDFSQTAEAIQQAGLAETLQGQGAFTVFAPTNEAWQQLPEEQRDRLMSDAGLSQLRTVVSYHVVPDEIRAGDIQQMGSVTTIQGQPLEVSRQDDRITVNDATVTQPGLQAANGVIHGIDAVLMPEQ